MTEKDEKSDKDNKSAKSEKDNTLPSTGAPGPLFQFTSTTQQNRQDIVQSSGEPGFPIDAFVTANLFELTALGASLDLSGHWNSTSGASPHADGPRSVGPPGGRSRLKDGTSTSGSSCGGISSHLACAPSWSR